MGPDGSGKTTLAKELGLPYYHFDKDSKYEDYLKPLCQLKLFNSVLDRFILCEYPYSTIMERRFAFTMKQWHNILLLALIQNPFIILCTHKPSLVEYSKSQYLPYDKWDTCLELYRQFLGSHRIPHLEYDYSTAFGIRNLLIIERTRREAMSWWEPMWELGYGAIGSPHPKVLLVAERLGPNNINNIPFEKGPTGLMLTNMLMETGTPLGKFTVTNMVKSYRRDTRSPNKADQDLLYVELQHLKPEKIVFLGAVAKQGIRVAKELGIDYTTLTHFGYYSHRGITSVEAYIPEWRKIMGVVPKLSL